MMLKKLTLAGCIVLSIGITAAGGGALLIRTSRAQDPKPGHAEPGVPTSKQPAAQVTKPIAVDPQLEQLLAAARLRAEAQRAYYEEGRITIDRFIDALTRLEKVQLIAAKTDAERTEIRQRYLKQLEDIEKRENAELQIGRGTIADLSEASERHLEAVYETKSIEREAAEKSAILRRLSDLERKIEQLQRERIANPAGGRDDTLKAPKATSD